MATWKQVDSTSTRCARIFVDADMTLREVGSSQLPRAHPMIASTPPRVRPSAPIPALRLARPPRQACDAAMRQTRHRLPSGFVPPSTDLDGAYGRTIDFYVLSMYLGMPPPNDSYRITNCPPRRPVAPCDAESAALPPRLPSGMPITLMQGGPPAWGQTTPATG